MCGRLSQYRGLHKFAATLNVSPEEARRFSDQPLARYNVAPSSLVALFHIEDDGLHVEQIRWGWAPHWAKGKPPTINARVEGVGSSNYFRSIWRAGRALVPADGWFEWVKDEADPQKKQPYFIKLKSGAPMFFAALGQYPTDDREESEGDGLVIITQASHGDMLTVHDRQPVVLAPEVARRWIDPELTSARAEELAQTQGLPAAAFTWYPVTKAVGNVKHNSPEVIQPIVAHKQ